MPSGANAIGKLTEIRCRHRPLRVVLAMMSIALVMRPPICLKALLSGLSTEGGRPVRGLYPWRSARARRPACVILTCVTSTGLPAAKVRPGVRARASLLRSMRRSGDKPGSGAELRVPPRRHLFPLRPALDCFRKPGKPRRGGAQCFVFCGIDVMGIVADQSPKSSVLGIPAKLFEAKRTIQTHEYVDTSKPIGIFETGQYRRAARLSLLP